MQLKIDPHVFTGMQKDMSVSKQKPESLYDARNLRFTARDKDTLMSVTNEKGTTRLTTSNVIEGNYLGHCVIKDYAVIFTHKDGATNPDYIYKVSNFTTNSATVTLLYNGNLGFSSPIEALGVFEKEDVQKAYWIDDNNQPRVINVANPESIVAGLNTQFDFVQELQLRENISVSRIDNDGMFSPGTIQYAFSYYRLYGQQTNIFYTTPLHYTSFSDRAGGPDDKVQNVFKIDIDNVDTNFEYLRIYSIHRTSLDAVPTVKRLVDLDISKAVDNKLTFFDSGMIGDIISPTELLYIGGEDIIAKAMATKDNYLFLGNLTVNRKFISESLKESLKSNIVLQPIATSISPKLGLSTNYYDYYTTFNSTPGFKVGEHYRLGIQFQHKNGKWSEPLIIGDSDYTIPTSARSLLAFDKKINIVGSIDISSYYNTLLNDGYVKYREICVFPGAMDKLVFAQGVLNPTVYNSLDRENGTPFAMSSWFFRPTIQGTLGAGTGNFYEFRHNHQLTGEIQNQYEFSVDPSLVARYYAEDYTLHSSQDLGNRFFVDQSIVTFHSPDVEFNTTLDSLDSIRLNLRLIGIANLGASVSACKIETSSASISRNLRHNKVQIFGRSKLTTDAGDRPSFTWPDGRIGIDSQGNYVEVPHYRYDYIIYPWQKTGSLNNDIIRPAEQGETTSLLKNKKISNLKYFHNVTYLENDYEIPVNEISLFSNDQLSLLKIPYYDAIDKLKVISYYGNVDTVCEALHTVSVNEATNNGVYYPTEFTQDSETQEYTFKAPDVEGFITSSRIKYKSTKHLVFSLMREEDGRIRILPKLSGTQALPNNLPLPYWFENNSLLPNPNIYSEPNEGGYSVQKLLYLDTVSPEVFIQSHQELLTQDNVNKGGIYMHQVTEDGTTKYIMYTVNTGHTGLTRYHNAAKIIYIYFYPNQGGNKTAFSTDRTTTNEYYVPGFPSDYNGPTNFIDDDTPATSNYIAQDTVTGINTEYPYLWLAEIYREPNEEIDFGGRNADAYQANLWLPAGEPKALAPILNLRFEHGDTWYQRYDCLKTFPFTREDENSIIEIGSFLCESRVNLNGRYDRNRGLEDNTAIDNTNFNLFNTVYNQSNNFFNYRILPDRFYKTNTFPNQVTWSLEKLAAQEIDNWTKTTLVNTLDVDGEFGSINGLHTFNNEVFYFQDKAFGKLSFNPRVLINATDGVPIEIGNSKKMEGKVVISDKIGCTNKWSICNTTRGLFFLDSNNKALYSYGDKLTSVSDVLMMDNWFKHKGAFNTERTYYDSKYQDLYLIWDNECLIFNDLMGKFTSFMDYGGSNALLNINDSSYLFKDRTNEVAVYSMFTGNYNYFFDTVRDYSLSFISNANSALDKIFSTIDVEVDFRNRNDDTIVHDEFFDTLRVNNEYQDTGEYDLSKSTGYVKADAKKKFRIWHVTIPRDLGTQVDRIRNTWAKISFTKSGNSDKRMELHNINVRYFI